jgi:hypothetical protein
VFDSGAGLLLGCLVELNDLLFVNIYLGPVNPLPAFPVDQARRALL